MYNNGMIHLYATLFLIIGALVTAFLYLRGEYMAEANSARPYFHPLTLTLILLIALIVPVPASIYYKAAILLGLILSLLASAARLLPGTPTAVNKAHLLIASLLYMTAFAALHPTKLPTPWLLFLLLYAGGMAWLLVWRTAELQSTLLIYGIILLLMSWQALEVLVVAGQLWAWILFIGALCLVLAESIQAIDRFYRPLGTAKLLNPAFLLLGQLLLALSIWGPGLGNAF